MASDTSSALMNEHFSCGKNRTQCLVGVHICDVKSSVCLTQKEIGSGEVITHEVFVKDEYPVVQNTVPVKSETSQFAEMKIKKTKKPKSPIGEKSPPSPQPKIDKPEMSDGDDTIEEVIDAEDDDMDMKESFVDKEIPQTQKIKLKALENSSLSERPKIPPIKPSNNQAITLDNSFTICAFDTKEGKTQLKSLFDEVSIEQKVSYKEEYDSNQDFQERLCVDPFLNMFSLKVHKNDVKRFDDLFSDKCRIPS